MPATAPEMDSAASKAAAKHIGFVLIRISIPAE
jgi:hypothetical protein